MLDDNFLYIAWLHAVIPVSCKSSPRSLSAPRLHSLLFQAFPRKPKPCCHVYRSSYSAERQPYNQFISLICLRPPSLQVRLPRRLHLLACITSCLRPCLSVCISVCQPASAPLLRPERDIICLFKGENGGNNSLFAYSTAQFNTIYYPHGMFYIPNPAPLPPHHPGSQAGRKAS